MAAPDVLHSAVQQAAQAGSQEHAPAVLVEPEAAVPVDSQAHARRAVPGETEAAAPVDSQAHARQVVPDEAEAAAMPDVYFRVAG